MNINIIMDDITWTNQEKAKINITSFQAAVILINSYTVSDHSVKYLTEKTELYAIMII